MTPDRRYRMEFTREQLCWLLDGITLHHLYGEPDPHTGLIPYGMTVDELSDGEKYEREQLIRLAKRLEERIEIAAELEPVA